MRKRNTLWIIGGMIVCILFLFMVVFYSGRQPRNFSEYYQKNWIEEPEQGDGQQEKKILKYAVTKEPDNLDPQSISNLEESTIDYHIFEGLLRNSEGKIIPAMAKSYEKSEDGLEYTFHLREAKWNDGTSVTADDFVKGIQCLVMGNKKYSFLAQYIKNGVAVQKGKFDFSYLGVRAENRKTLVITLERKENYFDSVISQIVFSPKKADDTWITKDNFRERYYNGPFLLKSWTNEKMVLEKNEEYWNKDQVKLNRVEIYFCDNTKDAIAMYENGNIDFISCASSEQTFASNSFYNGNIDYIKFNYDNPLYQNKEFREALAMSIDREKMVNEISNGKNEPAYRMILPSAKDETGTPFSNLSYKAQQFTYQPKEAQKKLKKALKQLKKQKNEITLTLLCDESEISSDLAKCVKQEWETILGIKVEIKKQTEQDKLLCEAEGKYDLVLAQWIPDLDAAQQYIEMWDKDSVYNDGKYVNDNLQKILAKTKQAVDEEESIDYVLQAEDILCKDVAGIPLQFEKDVLLKSSELKGLRVYHFGYLYNYIFADLN